MSAEPRQAELETAVMIIVWAVKVTQSRNCIYMCVNMPREKPDQKTEVLVTRIIGPESFVS